MEKLVHGIRNGELIGGPANARRMKHATREGNKPSLWTYLKANGCRGCQKQEEAETIHHVLCGGCEGLSKKENSRYREEMRILLQKSKNLMRGKHNSAGVIQADKALRALEQPRRQTTQCAREDEEQAFRQIVSGIIPEWQDASDKGKRGDMMNLVRIQIKHWMDKKNEDKARVQRRWDNRGIMKGAFQKWKTLIRHEHMDKGGGEEHKEENEKIEKTHGIKHWGRVRTIPRLHMQVKSFLQKSIG
eukprot:2592327-Pleurochrysis_carterae.AAC.1